MKDKVALIFKQVNANRADISDIFQTGAEFYFDFRGRCFSISGAGDSHTFFIYPRYVGDVEALANAMDGGIEHPTLSYVFVSGVEFPDLGIKDLYEWIQAKYLGLDEVMRDIGL